MKDEFIQTNQIPEILSKINGLDKEKSIKKKINYQISKNEQV